MKVQKGQANTEIKLCKKNAWLLLFHGVSTWWTQYNNNNSNKKCAVSFEWFCRLAFISIWPFTRKLVDIDGKVPIQRQFPTKISNYFDRFGIYRVRLGFVRFKCFFFFSSLLLRSLQLEYSDHYEDSQPTKRTARGKNRAKNLPPE